MIRPTSASAYRQMRDEGLLSTRRLEVYGALYEFGPATGSELCAAMVKSGKYLGICQSNVLTRLGELRDLGAVFEQGEKKCTITGMNVLLWEVTGKLPTTGEFKKEMTRNEFIVSLMTLLEEPYTAISSKTDLSERWKEWLTKVKHALAYGQKYKRKVMEAKH